MALHIADLGGDDNVTEAERAIIRRAAVIITEQERMEREFARSDGGSGLAVLEIYQRLSNKAEAQSVLFGRPSRFWPSRGVVPGPSRSRISMNPRPRRFQGGSSSRLRIS